MFDHSFQITQKNFLLNRKAAIKQSADADLNFKLIPSKSELLFCQVNTFNCNHFNIYIVYLKEKEAVKIRFSIHISKNTGLRIDASFLLMKRQFVLINQFASQAYKFQNHPSFRLHYAVKIR
ncbi:MAG: hypothetical protein BI182_05280 [Acetobacterium sp. MES1]|nr:MAG: hypothetical protein BI182_05280 [Acetobacterium sp. MES1]